MSVEQWFTLIGILTGVGLGLLNWLNGSSRNKSIGMLEQSQAIQNLNTSVDLANSRALAAEKRAAESERRAHDLETRLAILECDVHEKMTYRIVFDVVLGSNPVIERTDIKHTPERRKEDKPIPFDRRVK